MGKGREKNGYKKPPQSRIRCLFFPLRNTKDMDREKDSEDLRARGK